MKVGTRITVATSVVVAVTLSVYAYVDLRSGARAREAALEERARDVGLALRSSLELQGTGVVLADAAELSEDLSRLNAPWQVAIVGRQADGELSTPRAKRLKALIEARPAEILVREGDRLVYTLPLRRPMPRAPDGYEVAGAVEVSTSTAHLADAARGEILRTLLLVLVIVGLLVAAAMIVSRTIVSGPIHKLLAGVDDVAHGDLSRVLLSEREDEIGQLASRFNEMTYSLRESRAETERQNQARGHLEQRLFQTEKLATIGQIAAEIAHEVGTPLNVIAGRARSLAKKSGDPAAIEKNANIIAEQATRITRIIQRLLDFSRRKVGVVETELVDLGAVAHTTMEFIEGKLGAAGVTQRLERADALPPVNGHPDQLQQVLLNLFLNAVEAMPDGGALEVRTSVVTRRRPGLEMAPEQSTVVVEVSDTGPGIPPEKRDEIFEPFYTSKSGAGGTGLGLAVVHGIVKDHDGWVEVDDGPAGGTRFRVYLPAAEPEA